MRAISTNTDTSVNSPIPLSPPQTHSNTINQSPSTAWSRSNLRFRQPLTSSVTVISANRNTRIDPVAQVRLKSPLAYYAPLGQPHRK